MLSIEELVDKEREWGVQFGPYHREWLLSRANLPERILRNLEMARKHPHLVMTKQGFSAMDVQDFPPGSFPAIASTTTETNVVGTTAGNAARWGGVPANDARGGKAYECRFGGILSTTGTPTVAWTPRWGQSDTATSNVILGVSTAVATGSGLASVPVFGEFTFGLRSQAIAVTAGTGTGNGFVVLGNVAAAASQLFAMGSTVATTLPTESAQGLMISLTWGTNSASNTFTCQWFIVRSYN